MRVTPALAFLAVLAACKPAQQQSDLRDVGVETSDGARLIYDSGETMCIARCSTADYQAAVTAINANPSGAATALSALQAKCRGEWSLPRTKFKEIVGDAFNHVAGADAVKAVPETNPRYKALMTYLATDGGAACAPAQAPSGADTVLVGPGGSPQAQDWSRLRCVDRGGYWAPANGDGTQVYSGRLTAEDAARKALWTKERCESAVAASKRGLVCGPGVHYAAAIWKTSDGSSVVDTFGRGNADITSNEQAIDRCLETIDKYSTDAMVCYPASTNVIGSLYLDKDSISIYFDNWATCKAFLDDASVIAREARKTTCAPSSHFYKASGNVSDAPCNMQKLNSSCGGARCRTYNDTMAFPLCSCR